MDYAESTPSRGKTLPVCHFQPHPRGNAVPARTLLQERNSERVSGLALSLVATLGRSKLTKVRHIHNTIFKSLWNILSLRRKYLVENPMGESQGLPLCTYQTFLSNHFFPSQHKMISQYTSANSRVDEP